MATRIVGLLTIGVAGVLAATACKKTESAAGDSIARSGTGATAAVSATGGSTAAGGAGAASAASSGLTDANIVSILDQANAADSARGRVAQTKATNAEVKSFGRLMVGEHHALRQQGQALAKKLNVTPERPASDQSEAQAKQEMDSLNALAKGKAWDKAYIDYEVGFHQAVLQTATKALDAAQNQELKDLIKKAAPVIQHHLDRAQAIQKKLGT
jgi:putative membrane protein